MSEPESTPEPSAAEVRRSFITKALQHYRLMTFQMESATPGFSISGWQEQFLNAIAQLADKVEERIERDKQAQPEMQDDG